MHSKVGVLSRERLGRITPFLTSQALLNAVAHFSPKNTHGGFGRTPCIWKIEGKAVI